MPGGAFTMWLPIGHHFGSKKGLTAYKFVLNRLDMKRYGLV